MHIVKEAKTFETISTELLVVGVTKHREQMQDWASFSSFTVKPSIHGLVQGTSQLN